MGDDSTSAARLKQAWIDAGWKSARSFALDAGIDETTYRSHEMAPGAPGARAFDEASAQRYAERLDVNWMWLLFGDTVAPRRGEAVSAPAAGLTETQAAAVLRPILGAIGADLDAARPVARAFLKAVRAAQGLDRTRLDERDFEIAGAYAAQEAAREWKNAS